MADKDIQKSVVRHAQNDMANLPAGVSLTPAEPAAPAGRKLGEGQLLGMARLGGHELTQALAAFPDSNIRPGEEPGVVGNGNAPQFVAEEHPEYDPGEFARMGASKAPDRGRGR